MDVSMVIQDSKSGAAFDLTELLLKTTWETSMADQPGKLTFDFIDDGKATINPGSTVSFKVAGKGVFFGYVFKVGKKKDELISITAYDQMRYLKNKDTYVFSDMTAAQIFTKVCEDFKLKAKVINSSSYKIAPRVNDNKSLFEIIQHAIDETLVNTQSWFMVRDNFGVLEFINVNTLKTDVFIGDGSLLLNYSFENSIDSDSYNQIKLVKEDAETKKREAQIVFDSNKIKQWGLLQYFEKVDEKANPAQIKARAEMLLKLKNRETKQLSLSCLGDLGVVAGSGVVLGITDLGDSSLPLNKYFMVTSCTHSFSNDLHTMDLKVQVSI